MERADSFKAWLFFIVLIIFVIGGYFLMKQSNEKTTEESKNTSNEVKEVKDIRLDKTKDYIYFTDNEEIVHELDLVYKNININFNDSNNIAQTLNEENAMLKRTLTYDESNDEAQYNHLVNAKYNIYNTHVFDNYISLVVDYYEYQYETLVSYLYSKTYVFDKTSGHLLTTDEILNNYKLTTDEVLGKIKTHLEGEDVLKDNEELDEQATIDGIKELSLFIDKIGRLSISVLVKSDQKDYNEVIILN